ncbi:MAG TPA: PQQ-binding-like beta-propeller repeat protein [Gemmataceae bacterium]|jgi:outer membrane protein assembly factor BamB|nr:PQQ-binding-like beta-propeller repeat protein [Gemmataceae bacterium]
MIRVYLRRFVGLLAAVAVLTEAFSLCLFAGTNDQHINGTSGTVTPAGDWPVFRGDPLQTGVATSTLPNELAVRWKFRTKDAIEGTAAILGNSVYVGSMDGRLYALDLATGRQLWNYKAGPFKGPVGVHGGAVYAGDLDGTFHCVDAGTGAKRWTFDVGTDITSGVNFEGERVLFGAQDETLRCLSARDGKEVWKFKVPGGPVMGTPAVFGDRTFVSGCDSNLHVLDTAKGKEVASVDLEGQTGASVAVAGAQIYIGTMSNQVLDVDLKKAQVRWRYESARQQPFYASAAVTDALVIVGCRDKRVYALDRKTGREVWSFQTKRKVDSSPVVVDKRVFAASSDGNLYELDLARGTKLHQFELSKEGITASPAVGGHCLVIGSTEGVVYCLGAKR